MTDDVDAAREHIRADPFCGTLGIDFATIEPGYAETTLTVTEDVVNFNGKLHGAVIFALADAAAAAATQADGQTVVGIETNTSFLSAAEPGDTLIATARIIHESSQLNGTRVVVEKEDGTQIAMFRVRGYRIE
ncbi:MULTISPECIES: hotdog fold thioesterase [Natrialba]|uniref:Hotdog fold thioesterase n=1 Tax=Natrialba swarupiae TaxID=2448032 RepID=A0A5D5ASU8_9EURY|nr:MULTISPECIES: hotdog fold thioesterase [Natrialba]MWV38453.1 hotdog fold thioesterase [Natrialba sp. INN-245]TYT62590.1 hotdog fold thioesterase [Natrialba swarupiae]